MGRPATLRVDIVTNAKTNGVDQADGRLGALGRRAGKVGKAVAKGGAVIAAAAGYAAVEVTKSASRQQQAYGALDSIYGRSAKRVKAWARNAADSVGLARSEYAELGALVGAQLTGMGFAQDKAAGKTRGLIKTGADLAATFGGSVSDAVSAVSSLLKGETDPIERYGVSIKAADVEARLAADGLDNLTGKAAKQAKATALLSLLNEQTASSQGAFARESNTLAGQQERLTAKFENMKATIGAKLLPILTTLFTWVNNKLFPGLGRLGKEMSDRFGPTVTKIGDWITTRLVPAARTLFTWFMEKIYPSIRNALTPILGGLRSAFGSVSDAIERNREPLGDLVRFLGRVIEASGPVRVMMGKTLGFAFRAIGGAIGDAIDIFARLVGILGRVGSYIAWVIDKLRELGSVSPSKLLGKIGGLFSAAPVQRMTSPIVTGVSGLVGPAGMVTGSTPLDATAAVSALDLAARTAQASSVSYVDSRDLSVTVEVGGLGLVDPSILDRLQRALDARQVALGRRPAYSAG